MRDRLNEAIQTIQDRRHKARRYGLVMAVLALLTLLCVSWRLHQVGISMTADDELYHCGYEAHEHTEECYTDTLVCGYEEGELENPVDPEPEAEPEPEGPMYEEHHHTDDCYEEHEELICDQEEHVHEDYCYDAETGDLIDTQEEHEHDDSCYETVRELVCGYEEGELIPVEESNAEPEDTADPEPAEEPVYHHHTEACYEKELTCTIPEHEHTAACLADRDADVEDDSDWEQFVQPETSSWNEALVQVAKDQLGYTESLHNFELAADGETERHYTRYGTWYGNPYGAWDVMFAAFCQHYAGIPDAVIPQRAGLYALRTDLAKGNPDCLLDGGAKAAPGDLVTYNNREGEETIGIVTEADKTALTVISGAVDGAVAEVQITRADVTNTISVTLAYKRYTGASDADEDADAESPWMTLESDEQSAFEVKAAPENSKDLADLNPKVTVSIPNTGSDKHVNPWIPVPEDYVITEGDHVRFDVDFSTTGDTFKNGERTLHYQLPINLKPDSGIVKQDILVNNKVVGTYTVDDNGMATLMFNEDFDLKTPFTANFNLEGYASWDESKTDGTYTFPGTTTTIKLQKKTDIDVKKEGTSYVKTANGKSYLEFTVKVLSENGTGDEVTIWDVLNPNNDFKGSYDKDSFVLKKGESDVTISDKLTFGTNTDAYGSSADSFTISGLDALQAGETYTLTYRCLLKEGQDYTGSFENKAYAKYGEHDPEDSPWKHTFNSMLEKLSSYNSNTGLITWTIIVRNPAGSDLTNYEVNDVLGGGEIVGNVTITSGTKEGTDGGDIKTAYDTITNVSGTQGFTYKFGQTAGKSTNEKYYKFVYTTKVPANLNSVHNDVDISKDNIKIDGTSQDQDTATHRDWFVYKSTGGWSSMTLNDDGTATANWRITVVSQQGSSSFTATDVFELPKTNGETAAADHYALLSELDAQLKANFWIYPTDPTVSSPTNGFKWDGKAETLKKYNLDVKLTYFSDREGIAPIENTEANANAKVRSFKITVDYSKAGFEVWKINVNDYKSYVERSSLNDGRSWSVPNKISCENKEWPANYSYQKSPAKLKKIAGGSEYTFNKDVEYDEAGTFLCYGLWIETQEPEDSMTINDTLPEGVTYTGEYRIGFHNDYQKGSKNLTAFSDDADASNYSGQGHLKITPGLDGNQQTLKFELTDMNKLASQARKYKGILILYKVQVTDDEFWSDRANTQKPYTNHAKMGTQEAEATATVVRNTDYVIKTGVQEQNEGANTRKVTYTVKINPDALQLMKKGAILELTDELVVPEYAKATLDRSSVKLYKGDTLANEDLIYFDCEEVPEKDSETHYVMTLRIPDKTAYTLVYTYIIDTSKVAADKPQFNLKNSVTMLGRTAKLSKVEYHKIVGTATLKQDNMTLIKLEKNKANVTLGNVPFVLERYNKDTGNWDEVQRLTTDSDGKYLFVVSGGPQSGSVVAVQKNVLYRLTETEPPAGYVKEDRNYYFLFLNEKQKNVDGYKVATGENGALAGMTQEEYNSLLYIQSGVPGTLRVENAPTKLTVAKVWKNDKGNVVDAPQENITVKLYRYPKNGTVEQKTLVREIVLSNENNWSETVTEVDSNSLYYVEEVGVPNGYYAPVYTKLDGTAGQSGLTDGDYVTVTNQKKPDKLSVMKLWRDTDGVTPLANDLPGSITVVLYKKGTDGAADTEVTRKELTAAENWRWTFEGLDADALYYIRELEVNEFEVTYSTQEALAPGGATTVITNTRKASAGYELPSTGGTGTKRNTAGGFLLMGAALVCGVILRRRRERRGG